MFSVCVLVDFCLIFIFNVSQTIPQSVERIFTRTIYLCLRYLWTPLRYIFNCRLSSRSKFLNSRFFFIYLRVRLGYKYFVNLDIWWSTRRFIFWSSLWEILYSRILYFVDLSAYSWNISFPHPYSILIRNNKVFHFFLVE